MKKTMILAIMSLLVISTVMASTLTIYGIVTKDNVGIANSPVRISAQGSQAIVYTDSSGHYQKQMSIDTTRQTLTVYTASIALAKGYFSVIPVSSQKLEANFRSCSQTRMTYCSLNYINAINCC